MNSNSNSNGSPNYLEAFALTEKNKRGGAPGETETFWTRIGTAFWNNDGSLNIELNAYPVSGRMQLREPLPKTDQENDRRSQSRDSQSRETSGGREGGPGTEGGRRR